MIVSGAQQSDSAVHKHVSRLPHTALPSRLPRNIEQSSLCCTVGPCWVSILLNKCSSVYMSIPNSLTIPSLHPSPLVTISSFSKSVMDHEFQYGYSPSCSCVDLWPLIPPGLLCPPVTMSASQAHETRSYGGECST